MPTGDQELRADGFLLEALIEAEEKRHFILKKDMGIALRHLNPIQQDHVKRRDV
jgi:hypothetical protein